MNYLVQGLTTLIYPKTPERLVGTLIPENEISNYFTDRQLKYLVDMEAILEILTSEEILSDFQCLESDCYMILQLADEDETIDVRWEDYDRLKQQGKSPNPEHYECKYIGCLPANLLSEKDISATLENLFYLFNVDEERPDDFYGHSLSVSDIVALKIRGSVSYHYVDSVGFRKLEDFEK